jgi:hypothetical protein
MVDNNSILAHYDADLEGGGDHLIGTGAGHTPYPQEIRLSAL